MSGMQPDRAAIEALFQQLDKTAKSGGYNLNPDREVTDALLEGLLVNQARYGYLGCPCREMEGMREKDLDLICPCDYRDPDLAEYGTCFCGLYVSDEVVAGKKSIAPIPERRPQGGPSAAPATSGADTPLSGLKYPLWRCRVCGYLCARDEPPAKCPVCKADKDRFEQLI